MFDAKNLLNQIMGAGKGSSGALGDIGGMLGSVLNQAVSGVKEGAADLEQKTGVGAKANDALKNATGKNAGDLLNQAKDIMSKNQLATGAALGGLGALMLGTKGGRGLAGNAVALGGLALVGGLAYRAYKNREAGRPLLEGPVETPPQDSAFGETGDESQDQKTAMLVLRSMIAAAACDGLVDNEERSRIVGRLVEAGMDVHAAKFLDDEFARPSSIEAIVEAAPTPELRAQAFTAARLVIDADTTVERDFLTKFAAKLGLTADEAAHLEAAVGEAKQG